MSQFDVKFDNKEAYALFMLDNTMGLEGKALSNSPIFGLKSHAEAKRAELADKVSSFLRQHAHFIESDVDQERARALATRANIVAKPTIHPALVAKGAAAAAVVATVAFGADHFGNDGLARKALFTAVSSASDAVMKFPGAVGTFVSNQYHTVASYLPNKPWAKGFCKLNQTDDGVPALPFSCWLSGGNWTK